MDEIIINIENSDSLTIKDIVSISKLEKKVRIHNNVIEFLQQGRDQLQDQLKKNLPIYGINTGFGGNSDLFIPSDSLETHQYNLLEFLSAGTGDCFDDEYVRVIQLNIIIALCKGWSAVRPKVVLLLTEHLNKGILPQIPKYGSVGASGDLIPLSYVANVLCGKGKVKYNNIIMDSSEALKLANIEFLDLKSKEGLALVNGTRVMSAVSILTLYKFEKIYKAAIGSVALACEALLASINHLDMRIHLLKNHPGQIYVARLLNKYLKKDNGDINDDKLNKEFNNLTTTTNNEIKKLDKSVQEVYSLRCAPQILGVISESIESALLTIKREIFSANDNPLIDPYNGDPLSGGNFMGNHIARVMDGIKIDIALVANHLHSIVALMMYNGFSKNLPNSLSPNPGIYQGLKGMQISQTSLVCWLRQESSPSSIHSLTTEQFNQDIISLGLHSATGASNGIEKLCDIVSMTLIIACQAIDLRKSQSQNDFKLSDLTLKLYQSIRLIIPTLNNDRPTDFDIKLLSNSILNDNLNLL